MLRDNLAGLIAPMFNSAEGQGSVGHRKQTKTGGCSRSTELAIAAYKPSWSEIFPRRRAVLRRSRNCYGFPMIMEACRSRAVCTQKQTSHRTIDLLCLENPRPEGAESTLAGNPASPFHAEPGHPRIVQYLAEEHGVAINTIFFYIFEHEGQTFLSTDWLLDQGEVVEQAASSGNSG